MFFVAIVGHHDHNKSLNNFKKSGCEILSYETLEKKVQHFQIDIFSITTFPIAHNCDNWGVIIRNNLTNEKLCYVTDFFALPKVEGVNEWLFEIDYVEEYIDKLIDDGEDDKIRHTNFKYHCSLEKAIDYFSSLKTRPRSITICHLNKTSQNKKKILKTMSQFADIVRIAKGEYNEA